MNNNKRDKDNKSLITEFTNEWLRLRARFQVKDLFINLKMLKFFTMAPCCYIACLRSIVPDILAQLMHASSNSSHKHDKRPLKT